MFVGAKFSWDFRSQGLKPAKRPALTSRLKNTREKPHPCKKRKNGPPDFKSEDAASPDPLPRTAMTYKGAVMVAKWRRSVKRAR